jgi:hypothetical protein
MIRNCFTLLAFSLCYNRVTMNTAQKALLLSVADKLTMLGYAFGQEIHDNADSLDPSIAYDLAWSLCELEAELLTVSNKKVA